MSDDNFWENWPLIREIAEEYLHTRGNELGREIEWENLDFECWVGYVCCWKEEIDNEVAWIRKSENAI